MLFAFVVAATTCLFGEKIDIQNGLGWDGSTYGKIAKDPYGEIAGRTHDARVIQRVAPFAIAHVLLRPFVQPIGDIDVIRLFIGANVVGMTAVGWLVIRTLARLGAGPRAKWVAVLALSLSYAMATWLAYYPVLSDMPGLVIGAAMVHAYVRRSLQWLWVLTFLAGFTWPAAYYEGLILTIWQPVVATPVPETPFHRALALAVAAPVAIAFGAWALYLTSPEQYAAVKFNVHEPMRDVLPLAIALGVLYFLAGFWHLSRTAFPGMGNSLRQLLFHGNTWAAVLVLIGVVQWIVRWLAAETTAIELDVFPHMVVSAVFRPGIFFLSHVVFLGPLVVLAALAWPGVCRTAATRGSGFLVALGVMLTLGIGSESRRVINFLPLLVVLTVLALDIERWSWRSVAGFGLLCAVASKAWLPIGPLGDPSNREPRLFMNLGPWMTRDAYLLQLVGLAVVVATVWMLLRRARPAGRGAVTS